MTTRSLRELLDRLVVVSVDASLASDMPTTDASDPTVDWSAKGERQTLFLSDEESLDESLRPHPAAISDSRYRLLKLLGRGGMGEVWRARDVILDRTVALKLLHSHLATTPAAAERFLQEARAGAALQHPNVIPLYDVGRLADGRPFFTTREVHGDTLSERVRHDHTALCVETPSFLRVHATLGELLRIFLRICDTMAYAHSVGFVHRDLKPENVMVGQFGEVLVLDWGLSKRIGQTDHAFDPGSMDAFDPARSVYGTAKGTPAYMPPEQILGDGTDGPASDVYALGSMLFELLTGTIPYAGWNMEDLLAEKTNPNAHFSTPERMHGVDIQSLGALIRDCLSHDAAQRPPLEAFERTIGEWLVGSDRAVRARQGTHRAEQEQAMIQDLLAKAATIRQEAQQRLTDGAPFAEAWTHWQSADAIEHQRRFAEERHRLALQESLTHDPGLDHHRTTLAWHAAREGLAAWLTGDATAESTHQRTLHTLLSALDPQTAEPIRAAAHRWRTDGLMARLRDRSPFVPRDAQMAELESALQADHACVCLHGPPGVGRRRLAMELARARSLAGQVVVLLRCEPGETVDQVRTRLLDQHQAESSPSGPELLILLGKPGCEALFHQWVVETKGKDLRTVFAGTRDAVSGATHLIVPPLPTLAAAQLFAGRTAFHKRSMSDTPKALRALATIIAETGGLPQLVELAADQFLTTPLAELASALTRRSSPLRADAVLSGEVSRMASLRWQSLPPWAQVTLLQLSVVHGNLSMDCIQTVVRLDGLESPGLAVILERLTSWFLLEKDPSETRGLNHQLSPAAWLLCRTALGRSESGHAETEQGDSDHETTLAEARTRLADFLWRTHLSSTETDYASLRLSIHDVENLAGVVTSGTPRQAAVAARMVGHYLMLRGAYHRAHHILSACLERRDLAELDRRRVLLLLSGILVEQGREQEAQHLREQARRSAGRSLLPVEAHPALENLPQTPGTAAFSETQLHTFLRRSQAEASVTRVRLDLSQRPADDKSPEQAALLLDLARGLAATGALNDARAALTRVSSMHPDIQTPHVRAVVAVQEAWICIREGRIDAATRGFEAVLEHRTPDFDRHLLVWLLEGLAQSIKPSDPERAVTLRRDGLLHVLAGFGGFDAQRLSANLGNDLFESGEAEEAYVVLRESLERFTGRLEGIAVALIYDTLAWICMHLGRWDEAADTSRRSVSSLYDDQLGYRGYLARTRALVLTLAGHDVAARRILLEHPLGPRGSSLIQTIAGLFDGMLQWLLGEPDPLREQLDSLDDATRTKAQIDRWVAMAERLHEDGILLGPDLTELSSVEKPDGAGRSSVGDDIEVECTRWFQIAESMRLAGRMDKARFAFLQSRIRATAVGRSLRVARAEHGLGMVASSEQATHHHLHRAIEIYVELGYPDRAIAPRGLLAQRLARRGQIREAELQYRGIVSESLRSADFIDRAFASRRNTHIHFQLQLGKDVLDTAEEVVRYLSETDLTKSHGIALANLGLALWMAGRQDEAQSQFHKAIQRMKDGGLKALRWELQMLLTRLGRAKGDLVDATIAVRRLQELGTDQKRQQMLQGATMAAIRARRGEREAGREWLDRRPGLDDLPWADASVLLSCWIEVAANVGAWDQLEHAAAAETRLWNGSDVSPRSYDRLWIAASWEEAHRCALEAGVELPAIPGA